MLRAFGAIVLWCHRGAIPVTPPIAATAAVGPEPQNAVAAPLNAATVTQPSSVSDRDFQVCEGTVAVQFRLMLVLWMEVARFELLFHCFKFVAYKYIKTG